MGRKTKARSPEARDSSGLQAVGTLRMGALLAVMLALAAALTPGSAYAQSVEQFYAGRQLKLFVGGGAGGGYDFYGRIIAPYMSKHLPGNPSILIQGMPGAGGIVAANHLYNRSSRDGSEFGIVGRVVSTHPLLNPKDTAVKYDPRQFNWIGTPLQEVGLLIVRGASPVNTLKDLKVHQLMVAGTAPSAPPSFYPAVMNKVLGTKFQIISGYASLQEALFAVERGETDGYVASSASAALRDRIAPWIKEGKVKLVMQIGLSKDPRNGDVPLVLELAETAIERQLMELILTQQVMAWPFVAPPGVPDDRVKALRDAFDATMKDPAFLAEAAKTRTEIDPVSGLKLHELLDQIHAMPKETLDRLQSLSAKP
jgi:tripartite-type tricarboxylate transporter receptor subunit TctC